MDLQPGMDPANPYNDVPLYLRDQPPVIMHERNGQDWVSVRVAGGTDQVWLYAPVDATEAVELLAAHVDDLDAVVACYTSDRPVVLATAYEGRITSLVSDEAPPDTTPLATAHRRLTHQ